MNRGEIWHCDLSPAAGREQMNPHYVVIVSVRSFNKVGMPVICPITTVGKVSRMTGFAVNLQGSGTGVTGVIQVDQVMSIDMTARKGKATRETVPDYLMAEVDARLAAILGLPLAEDD